MELTGIEKNKIAKFDAMSTAHKAGHPEVVLMILSYGSCRSLFGHRIGVGLPALVSLPGAVLVAAAP